MPDLVRTLLDNKRECECPEWVLRCAHWEGRVLVLSGGRAQHEATCFRQSIPEGPMVCTVYEFGAAYCGCNVLTGRKYSGVQKFSGLPSAIQEFHRREAELLRSGDA